MAVSNGIAKQTLPIRASASQCGEEDNEEDDEEDQGVFDAEEYGADFDLEQDFHDALGIQDDSDSSQEFDFDRE